MKLFYKFLLLSSSAAVGPLALAGAGLLAEAQDTLRQATLRLQRGVAEKTAAAAAAYLDNARAVLDVVHKGPAFLSPDPSARGATLQAVLDNYPLFMDLSVHGRGGGVLSSLSRLGAPRPPSDWAAVQRAVEERGFYVGGLDRPAGDYPSLALCVPLVPAPGRQEGYFCGRVNLLDLSERLKGLDLGAGGVVRLADTEGRLLAQSTPGVPSEEKFSPPPAPREGEYRGADGRTLVGVREPVRGTDWFVVLEQPAEEAFRVVRQARRRILAALAGSALSGLALCGILTRRLGRPLAQFRDAVRRMRGGHFDALITVDGTDEVGEVARELREAQSALEKKVRQAAVGLAAHRIGHDMRGILMTIRMRLEGLARRIGDADPAAVKNRDAIAREVERGTEYLEEILTFGRERPPRLRSTDMNGLVRDLLGRPAGFEVPPVVASLSADLPPCPLDEEEARRALWNVIQNAREAAGRNGRVEVRTASGDGRLEVRVTDDGPGVPPEVRERLFEDFLTTKPHGTGLGLGIVKRVLDRHGGTVRLGPAPGRGTEVVLSFPLQPAEGVPA